MFPTILFSPFFFLTPVNPNSFFFFISVHFFFLGLLYFKVNFCSLMESIWNSSSESSYRFHSFFFFLTDWFLQWGRCSTILDCITWSVLLGLTSCQFGMIAVSLFYDGWSDFGILTGAFSRFKKKPTSSVPVVYTNK